MHINIYIYIYIYMLGNCACKVRMLMYVNTYMRQVYPKTKHVSSLHNCAHAGMH